MVQKNANTQKRYTPPQANCRSDGVSDSKTVEAFMDNDAANPLVFFSWNALQR